MTLIKRVTIIKTLVSLWNVNFFAMTVFLSSILSHAEMTLRVTDDQISRLQSVLSSNGLVQTGTSTQELETLFRTRSAAHRLRLSQVFLKITKDPQFLKQFPEFEPLVKNAKKTVTALLEHDASKGNAATAKAIRVLTLTQGLNYRNPPKNLSAADQKLLVDSMKNAIDDLNTVDDKFMDDILRKVSPNAAWKNSHDSLTETIDFYDTYKSRQAELAKDGKALVSPSQWIEQLEAEGHYSKDEMKGNGLKKRFAKYLEKVDPLADSANFAKTEDFAKLAKSTNFQADLEKSFSAKGRSLVFQATKMQATKTMLQFANSAKAIPISYALLAGVDYIASPETANATDTLAQFTGSTETSNCDSVGCQNFVKQCLKILKLKEQSLNQLAMNENFPKCINDFFSLSLEDQTKRRRDDSNLNTFLTQYSPNIDTLTCSPDGMTAKIDIKTDDRKWSSTKMTFTPNSTPAQIAMDDDVTKIKDRLRFSNSVAQGFQHCESTNGCKNYEIKDMLNIKLGIWRDDRLPRIASGPFEQVSIKSFTWARKAHQMAENQAESIKECCGKNACQNYFSDQNSESKQIRRNLTTLADR
ncbi:MAG: hypothetical protein H7256_00855 [Bdellovibrio sp.]|nr:hypothetical protein [Bdellovibrio sp.]